MPGPGHGPNKMRVSQVTMLDFTSLFLRLFFEASSYTVVHPLVIHTLLCFAVLDCKLSIFLFFTTLPNILPAVTTKLSFLTIASHTILMRKI